MMKDFWVTVNGFCTYQVWAETRSKARYKAYCQYVDAWNWIPFKEFLSQVKVEAGWRR